MTARDGGFAKRAWAERDAAQKARAKSVDLVALIGADVKLARAGKEFKGLCPFHQEKTPSFTVVPSKGFFKCFGCGATGDAIEYVRRTRHVEYPEALTILSGDDSIPRARGVANPSPSPLPQGEGEDRNEPDPDRARDIKRAFAIWKEAKAAAVKPVATYLGCRGIDVGAIGGVPPSLRFHPALMHWGVRLEFPCMVALLQGADDAPTGIHRTYLAADASKKAELSAPKMILGGAMGSAIRFTVARPWLVIGEGIETVLSAMQACGVAWNDNRLTGDDGRPLPGFWCAVSLGNMAGRGMGRGDPHPDPLKADPRGNRRRLPARTPDMEAPAICLPARVRRVTILRDRDASDVLVTDALVARAVNRWRAEGRRVEIANPPAGMDFNDWLNATRAPKAGAA